MIARLLALINRRDVFRLRHPNEPADLVDAVANLEARAYPCDAQVVANRQPVGAASDTHADVFLVLCARAILDVRPVVNVDVAVADCGDIAPGSEA